MIRISTASLVGSFALAAFVWLAVTLNKPYTAHVTVPLTMINLPSDVALARPLPPTVDVALEGSGWQLLIVTFGRRPVFELPGDQLRSNRVLLLNRYLSEGLKLPEGVTPLRAFPETLAVAVDEYIRRKVPLRLSATGITFQQDFGLAGPIVMNPDSVVLMGAERILRGLTSWPTVTRTYADLAAAVSVDVPIADSLPGLVRFTPERTHLVIPVEQLADMEFSDVPVTVTDVPEHRQVLLAVSSVTLYVRGGVDRLAEMSNSDFSAIVGYAALLQDSTGYAVPEIHLPAGVQLLRVTPPRMRFTIRQ